MHLRVYQKIYFACFGKGIIVLFVPLENKMDKAL